MSETNFNSTYNNFTARSRKPMLAWLMALLAGLSSGVIVLCQPYVPFGLPILPILFMPAVYAFGGMAPAVALAAMALGTDMAILGVTQAFMLAPGFWLPAMVMLRGMKRRDPFFVQLKQALIAALGGMGITILIVLGVYGEGFLESVFGVLSDTFNQNREFFWQSVQGYLSQYGSTMDLETFSQSYNEVLLWLRLYYSEHMVANLLSGSAITAIVGTFWGNWLASRRDRDYGAAYVPPEQWQLPDSVTHGLLSTLILAFVLTETGLRSAPIAWNIVSPLICLAFCVQAICSLRRQCMKQGKSYAFTQVNGTLNILILLIFASTGVVWFYTILGAGAALIGKEGAPTRRRKRRKDSEDGDTEDTPKENQENEEADASDNTTDEEE